MARLDYPNPEDLTERTRDILTRMPDINIFRMMSHCEVLMPKFVGLGNSILRKMQLNPVFRELAIVRAAVHCNSAYELRQHDAIALEEGASQEKIDALRHDDLSDVFSEQEKIVVRFTDEVIKDIKVSDATFAQAKAFLSPREIQELIITVGYYSMVGRLLETLEIDLETGDDIKVVQVGKLGRDGAG